MPVLASIPFGAGYLLIFSGVLLYFLDIYEQYAASALAANSVIRLLFGMAFPLFARKLFEGLGVNWALMCEFTLRLPLCLQDLRLS